MTRYCDQRAHGVTPRRSKADTAQLHRQFAWPAQAGPDVLSTLLYCVAATLALVWLGLRVQSHRIRREGDRQTTWDQRSRGLPNTTYAVVVGLATISILGVVLSVYGGSTAAFGIALSIIGAVAAAGLRRKSFASQYNSGINMGPHHD